LFLFFIGVAVASTDHEMRVIAKLESSSGKNLNHPVVKTGMHKGHQAAGRYGLMPLTIKDIVDRSPTLKTKYGYLLDLAPSEITEEINRDGELDKTLATHLWTKLRKTRCPNTAAFAWYHGPHASVKNMKLSPYVIKFTKEMERIKDENAFKRTRPVPIPAS